MAKERHQEKKDLHDDLKSQGYRIYGAADSSDRLAHLLNNLALDLAKGRLAQIKLVSLDELIKGTCFENDTKFSFTGSNYQSPDKMYIVYAKPSKGEADNKRCKISFIHEASGKDLSLVTNTFKKAGEY